MDLYWLGSTGFRMVGASSVVLVDPPDDGQERTSLREADIVAYSRMRPERRSRATEPGKAFEIDGPGEYEIGGVFVVGVRVPGPPASGDEARLVTAYCVSLETLTVCHLGPLHAPPSREQIEALGAVDVLLVPVGGESLTPAQAVEVVNMVEPTLVVPMCYRSGERPEQEPIARFCEEMGVPAAEPVPVLRVSRTRLPIERQVVLLEPTQPSSGLSS